MPAASHRVPPGGAREQIPPDYRIGGRLGIFMDGCPGNILCPVPHRITPLLLISILNESIGVVSGCSGVEGMHSTPPIPVIIGRAFLWKHYDLRILVD